MKETNSTLIAELGGTNASIVIAKNGRNVSKLKQYHMADFSSIDALLHKFFEETKQKTSKGIIGVAAPVTGEEIRFTNNSIQFNKKTLKDSTFPQGLKILNDLELQACALEDLDDKDLITIRGVKEEKKGSKVLISPGTGLGLAGIVDRKVVFTEGGHLNVPADSEDLNDILKKFNEDKGRHATFEDLLSGKGISYIFQCLNSSNNPQYSNEEILANKTDSACLGTRKLMLYLLAVYSKYIALIWGTTSGIFFSGSMANSLLQPEDLDSFRVNFESSPTMKELLLIVPIFLIKDLNLGLRGGLILASKG